MSLTGVYLANVVAQDDLVSYDQGKQSATETVEQDASEGSSAPRRPVAMAVEPRWIGGMAAAGAKHLARPRQLVLHRVKALSPGGAKHSHRDLLR